MSDPDFDQKALNILDAVRLFSPDLSPVQTKVLAQTVIAEQLRIVWNARGAADLKAVADAMEWHRQARTVVGSGRDVFLADRLTDAIRSLDR